MSDPLNDLHLDFKPAVGEFVEAVAHGTLDEVALFGPRGEGKTIGVLGAMVAHAHEHRAHGAALPTRWIGFTDTFRSHERNTLESLRDPLWKGCWEITDGGALAAFRLLGQTFVRLDLFGVDSPRDANKVRTQCHGAWCEEPAPAQDVSSGIELSAWEIALTSMRLPSHANVGVLSANYPDEDHWCWKRFVSEPRPGTGVIRIPRGERTTPEQRERWASQISDPVLRRRLLEGEPGVVILGEIVASGYNPLLHVAPEPFPLLRGELWMGHDSGNDAHHHATVIAQVARGRVRVLAGLVTGHAGFKQHLERTVLPWLAQHAPWVLEDGGEDWLHHRYDPSMQTDEGGDIDQSPLRRLMAGLGGHILPGAVSWTGRISPVLALFQEAIDGAPALAIVPGPDTDLLRKALGGRWYYPRLHTGQVVRDLPAKPNHPWEDLGDAFCYLIGGVRPARSSRPAQPRPPRKYGRVYGALR